jgi:hypothetical protein
MRSSLRTKHVIFLVVGAVIGLSLGLLVTWQVWPVEYYDTDPADLRAEHKDDYVVMIAAAYSQDDDLGMASFRLGQLGLEDVKQAVLGLFQRYGNAGYTEETRSLARLAYDLGVTDVALLPYMEQPTPTGTPSPVPTATETPTTVSVPTVTPMEPTATTTATAESTATPTTIPPTPTYTETATQIPLSPTPTRTATPEDTATPTVAADFDYQLVEKKDLGCVSERDADYILVYVRDEEGRGVAGVELLAEGPEVEDTFYTGLKPEVDSGFADLLVNAPGTYTVQVAGTTSQLAEGLSFDDTCDADAPHRVWQVIFRRVGG